jgi:hypothetical protein
VEPHICLVANRTTDSRGEFVEVANSAAVNVALTGLEITDYTSTQQHVHVYHFPGAQGGGALMLPPGCSVFVFTGAGQNKRLNDGDLLLFAGRGASIWNNDGDVAYLRRRDGTFVASLTVGHPKRHPNGH